MKNPESYKFREFCIPIESVQSLLRYVQDGIDPGSFLKVVLCNDLVGACCEADDGNLRNIPAYAAYLHNKVPAVCWGTKERVAIWMEQGGQNG